MTASFTQIEAYLKEQNLSPHEVGLFQRLYAGFQRHGSYKVDWEEISTPEEGMILEHETLPEPHEAEAKSLIQKTAVCRLNGGLGTTMGCVGPKSAIEVRDNMTFMDMIVTQLQALNQRFQADVPLVLMNSFNTDQDTHKIIKKYVGDLNIYCFKQNRLPRLRKDSLMPMSVERFGEEAFYPPGHGDFFDAFPHSGILDQLLAEGREWLFIANADNLGANVDLRILKYMADSHTPFVMEVTPKTRADVKGGTLVKTTAKPLHLLEIAQVPKEHTQEFKSIKKFKIFNTNNSWINLKTLKEVLTQGPVEREVLINHKTVKGVPVIQLETALGAGVAAFEGAKAVAVPRSRFLPVKKTDDLLLVQSNIFKVEQGVLVRNPARQFPELPMIRLGEFFKSYEQYQERFETIPDILDLDLLTVVGDVWFGADITLKGNVITVCDAGRLHLPRGSLLENKVLTGNIEIGEL